MMNARFPEAAREDFASIGNKEEFDFMQRLIGPESKKLKGFAHPIEVFRLGS